MINSLVTVVLPVYNVEKYLDRCIKSVVNQTYSNLDILLVDDGSSDGSSEICDNWAKLDNRIRVIHKDNAGLGMARNTGLENAMGDYICFVDSDDYIAENTVEKALILATDTSSDLVLYGINTVDSFGNVISSFHPDVSKVTFDGSEVQSRFFPDYIAPDPSVKGRKKYYMSPCLLLYSMDLIHRANWRFVSEREIISEDVYTQLMLFRYVNRVSILPDALYFYCHNDSSLSRRYIPNRYDAIKNFYCKSVSLCQKMGYSDVVINRVSKPYLSFTISVLKQECSQPRCRRDTLDALKRIVDDEVLQEVLNVGRNDKAKLSRRILFFALRHKMYAFCYLLLKAKN